MPKAEYREYLRTHHWRRVRSDYFDKHPRQCFVCEHANRPIHLHHRTYKNVGHEPHEDLVPLCERCHTALHKDESWHADSHILLRQKYLELRSGAFSAYLVKLKPAKRPKRRNPHGRAKPPKTVKGYYACPKCSALPGDRCRSSGGKKRKLLHPERFAYAENRLEP